MWSRQSATLCAQRPAEQTAWLLPKDGQCKRAWDWNADTLCSSAVIKGNAGNNRPIFTSTWRTKTLTDWEAAQCSGLLPGALSFWLYVRFGGVNVSLMISLLSEYSAECFTLYLIFSRALWTWIHFPSTKNFKSEISGLSNSFFKDCATVR